MRLIVTVLLGAGAFVVLMFCGETGGIGAGVAAMGAYLCTCEFLLARKQPKARRSWPPMLSLDGCIFLVLIGMCTAEKPAVILSQGAAILLAACGGTYLGAMAASLTSRRPARR